jgi:hypothetical protein
MDLISVDDFDTSELGTQTASRADADESGDFRTSGRVA